MDSLSAVQRSHIQAIKDNGAALFAPDKGGSYAVFNKRPLDDVLVHYCMQDVVHMPALWNTYHRKLRVRFWQAIVDMETEKRLDESRSAGYVPQGKHKSLGWSWDYLRQLEREWNA